VRAGLLAAALVAVSGAAQSQGLPVLESHREIAFSESDWDVTGAGDFAMPGWEAAIGRDAKLFAGKAAPLVLALRIGADGAPLACRSGETAKKRARAGNRLCAHVMAHGRFTPRPRIVLAYREASMTLAVRAIKIEKRGLVPRFQADHIPLQNMAVRFPEGDLPPESERMQPRDIIYGGFYSDYPSPALRNAIEADVRVHLRFDDQGRMATCRPLHSSNTAWMAYATCGLARRIRAQPAQTGPRDWVGMVRWRIAD
jgi:hypothetical protein